MRTAPKYNEAMKFTLEQKNQHKSEHAYLHSSASILDLDDVNEMYLRF